MKQKELIAKIENLEISIRILRDELIAAKVLQGRYGPYHYYDNENLKPISLIELKNQVDGIKDFLGIKFVEKPAVPAESYMEKQPSTDDDGGY